MWDKIKMFVEFTYLDVTLEPALTFKNPVNKCRKSLTFSLVNIYRNFMIFSVFIFYN